MGRQAESRFAANYAASKAGIVMLTRQAALENGEFGVRINCVAPGTVLSERVRDATSPEQVAQRAREIPLGRVGLPEEVASTVVFLASEASSFLTGVTLDITGGRAML